MTDVMCCGTWEESFREEMKEAAEEAKALASYGVGRIAWEPGYRPPPQAMTWDWSNYHSLPSPPERPEDV